MTLKEYMIECMDNIDNPKKLAEMRYNPENRDCGYRSGLAYLGLPESKKTEDVCRFVIYDRYKPVDNQLRLF